MPALSQSWAVPNPPSPTYPRKLEWRGWTKGEWERKTKKLRDRVHVMMVIYDVRMLCFPLRMSVLIIQSGSLMHSRYNLWLLQILTRQMDVCSFHHCPSDVAHILFHHHHHHHLPTSFNTGQGKWAPASPVCSHDWWSQWRDPAPDAQCWRLQDVMWALGMAQNYWYKIR